MMRIVRYILFLPAGFVASVILGALAKMAADVFPGIERVSWSTGGAVSAVAFLLVGVTVLGEHRSQFLVGILVAVSAALGFLGFLGSLLANQFPQVLSGAAMVIVSIVLGFRLLRGEQLSG